MGNAEEDAEEPGGSSHHMHDEKKVCIRYNVLKSVAYAGETIYAFIANATIELLNDVTIAEDTIIVFANAEKIKAKDNISGHFR